MMMGLRDIESRLPPGFRFHPSDTELLCYYLRAKVVVANNQQGGSTQQQPIISPPPPATIAGMIEVDLHEREPWELPVAAKLSDNEWYFFSFRDRKYATGTRTNRATKLGYWKATGKDKVIHHHDPAAGMVIGTRKTLVFYFGRAPNGRKSGWVMHEFRLATEDYWVLCRVFHKQGEDEQRGSRCRNNNSTIDPGASTWSAGGLCSPPPQLQPPTAADSNSNNSQSQLLLQTMSVSSPIMDDGHDDLVATLLQAAQEEDTSSFHHLFSDLATSAGDINGGDAAAASRWATTTMTESTFTS